MIANNNRIWIVGTVILSLAVVALGWLLGISPKLNEASASDLQTLQVGTTNQQQQQKVAQLKADFDNLPTVQAELAQLQAQIPSNSDYPAFLSELDTLASDENVTVTNVSFASPTVLTAGGAASSSTSTPSATSTTSPKTSAKSGTAVGSVVTIPTTLTLSGTFDHLQSAIGSLQTGSRLLLVSGLSFSSSQHGDSASATYSATVTGLLYVLTNSKTLIEDPSAASTPTTPAPSPTPTSTAGP